MSWRGGEALMNYRTTYQVMMSTDGHHRVTVTIEDPGGTDAALAWAKATYSRLLKANGQAELLQEESLEAPECAVHFSPMERMQGRLGPFWSCHQKNRDGSWCSYKPKGF